ncbi:hypothetical protein [Brevundimonas sp.]|uniref:hypothetical protein n=1 Tax=Brevundimonas sp. TaxID=1871086 RepID=UPI003D0A8254
MTAVHPPNLVLGLYPMRDGFAWIVYDGPFNPWAWRMVWVSAADNEAILQKAIRVFEVFRPRTLVLEAFEPSVSSRSERMTLLGRELVAVAYKRDIEVVVLRRSDVQDCFSPLGAMTRHEIADAVARQTPSLEALLPGKRKAWEPENLRMALFSAAALVVAHFSIDARRFLAELSDQTPGDPPIRSMTKPATASLIGTDPDIGHPQTTSPCETDIAPVSPCGQMPHSTT